MSQEVINKVPAVGTNNLSLTNGTYNPGPTLGYIFHPKDIALLDADQLNSIFANIQAEIVAVSYAARSFFLRHLLPDATNNGEARAYQTRAQKKYLTAPGTFDMIYTIDGNYADYIQALNWAEGVGKAYRAIPIDDNMAMRHQRSTSGGIIGFEVHAIEVQPIEEASTSQVVGYTIRIALRDRKAYDKAEHTHITDANGNVVDVFDGLSGLRTIEQVIIMETTFGSPGNGIHYISIEAAAGEENLVALYQAVGQLKQAGAYSLVLADGSVVAITSVGLITVDGVVRYISLTLDQDDYANGNTGYLKLAAPSTLNGFIPSRWFESNTIKLPLVK